MLCIPPFWNQILYLQYSGMPLLCHMVFLHLLAYPEVFSGQMMLLISPGGFLCEGVAKLLQCHLQRPSDPQFNCQLPFHLTTTQAQDANIQYLSLSLEGNSWCFLADPHPYYIIAGYICHHWSTHNQMICKRKWWKSEGSKPETHVYFHLVSG